jgi:3-hydroxyacyl-CoA dehydrogenase / enoyl-CoA hydratase / 3-hydroxybutyryl-CoA epimerase
MTLEAIVDSTKKNSTPGGALSLRVRDDGVAVVVYDVPGEPVNTLKASFSKEFQAMLSEVERDPRIEAVVLISGKPDSFIAGADIEMLKAATTAREAEALCRTGHEVVARLAGSKKPFVAAVHGAALGGGFEVALACQARVVTDDKKTVLGFPEVQLGILPGLNGLERLAEKAGLQVALDYGLSGKNMRPVKARQLGIADDVVSRSILEEVAIDLARKLASGAKRQGRTKKPPLSSELTRVALEENPIGRAILFQKARTMVMKRTHGHYPAPLRIIDVLKTFASDGFDAAKEIEARAFGELAVSSVARRLMDLFFAQTALKKDSGVDDLSVKPRPVAKVFVLGAGLMGSGIAYVTAVNGDMHVRMKDRDDPSTSRGLRAISDILDDRVKKKQMSRIERDQKLALITVTTDDSGLRAADLVIEAVFEDLEVKHKVLRDVEERAKPGVIFASNTSSLPITKIASVSRHPENVVGMHYFSPVPKMPLLEVIRTDRTDPATLATAVAVGKKQGKTVIVVGDGPGFYTTRVLAPYINEACWLLTEGLAVDAVDKALVDWGWPVGPFTLTDEVGIDVGAHVGQTMLESFGDRVDPAPIVDKLVKDGRKGRKNEKGFYLYGEAAKRAGKGKRVDETVYTTLGLDKRRAKSKLSTEDIQLRCSLQFVNEAIHCFGERILRSPRDGDVGAVFGLGFPPFRGGPFRFVDEMGSAEVLRRMRSYEQALGKRWTPAPVLVEMAAKNKTFYSD